jgi:FLVCR family feline leukemia virus subgroup C receptor-related protein
LNSPGKIASNWFREDKRTIICSLIYLSDTAGILVGYLWNMAYIKKNVLDKDYKDHVFRYLLSEFILIFFLCMAAVFINKDKPDKLVSPSQNKEHQKLSNDLRNLFSNIKFIVLLISMFFIVGYYFIINNIFNNLLFMYKITKYQCTVIYSVSITIGIISSLIISFFVDKYKKFKLIMVILCASATLFQVFLTFLLEIDKSKGLNPFAICFVFYTLINAAVIPFYTIGMNYACEITYPVSETMNGGILMIISQLCGIGGTYLFDYLINSKKKQTWLINCIFLLSYIIPLICSFFFDEKLSRYEIDKIEKIKEEVKQVKDNESEPVK